MYEKALGKRGGAKTQKNWIRFVQLVTLLLNLKRFRNIFVNICVIKQSNVRIQTVPGRMMLIMD